MPVTIKNLKQKPVIMSLNSGNTLHLFPGQTADGIHDVEIRNNVPFGRLLQQGLIAVTQSRGPSDGSHAAEEKPEGTAAERRKSRSNPG
jgi:hypothetical protein